MARSRQMKIAVNAADGRVIAFGETALAEKGDAREVAVDAILKSVGLTGAGLSRAVHSRGVPDVPLADDGSKRTCCSRSIGRKLGSPCRLQRPNE